MKKGLILLATLLVVASFTVSGHAQGLSGIWPGSSPMVGAYPPYAGKPLFENPTFYVGWMESTRKITWSFADPDPGGLFGGAHKWDVTGLWLGLEEKINLNQTCGVDLDGWVLIPSTRQGAELEASTTTISTVIHPTSLTTVTVTSTVPVQAGRTWNTRPEWWYLDAAATYAFSDLTKAIAGFRYERFSTRFDNPTDVFGLVTNPDASADLTVNSYLPYLGLQCGVGGPASSVYVRFIGFPVAPANLTHTESGLALAGAAIDSTGNWKRSYFWEIFAEYNRNFAAPGMGIGAFLRWNVLHGETDLDATLPGGTLVSSDAALNRNTLTFGGSLTLNLGSPF